MDKHHQQEIYYVKVLCGIDTGSDHYVLKIRRKFTPQKKQLKTPKIKRKIDPTQLMTKKNTTQQHKK